jgi:hypothetical protein
VKWLSRHYSPRRESEHINRGHYWRVPELNPFFREIIVQTRRTGRHEIDRRNLTVLFERDRDDLPAFLAEHQVEIVASLPCYTAEGVDMQRGRGVFNKSIRSLLVQSRCVLVTVATFGYKAKAILVNGWNVYYFLIGLRSCKLGVLSNIRWSQPDAFAQTLARLQWTA